MTAAELAREKRGAVPGPSDGIVAYDARPNIHTGASEICLLIKQVLDQTTSTFFREGAKTD